MKLYHKKSVLEHIPVSHGGPYSIKDPDSKVLDFSSNINPFGIFPLIRKKLETNLDAIQHYPDPESHSLRKKLESYTKTPYSQIVVGNGAMEIIYNFCQAFLSKKTPVLIAIPTFGEYEAAAKLNGSKVIFFRTMNLNDDLRNFIKKIPKTGCVFLCNPNNPTGTLVKRKKLLEIVKACVLKSTILFVDECFIELAFNSDESIVKSVKKFENLFVLRSLTKSFGLPGIRIGYGIGNKQMITILNKIKIPWNVNGMAQRAAEAALDNSTYLEKAKNLVKTESKFLRNQISKINGFECSDTEANFILIKTRQNSKTIQRKLLEKKILVRDCKNFRGLGSHFIRVAIKSRKENLLLIKSFKRIS